MEKFKINEIDATLIQTNKFKTLTLFVAFFGEYTKENATKKAMLSRLLGGSTKKYQTKKQIVNKLFDLYDASIVVTSFPIYKTNVTLFALTIVNPKYVEDDSLLTEAFAFFKEFIFNPNIENNQFNEREFNEKKRILKDSINNIYNNKGLYAFRRLLDEMGKDEIISVSPQGSLEELEKMTPASIYEEYELMLNTEMPRIYVTGDIEAPQVSELFVEFGLKNNVVELQPASYETKEIAKANEVIETQNINQAQLMMGFRSNVNALDELYVPMAVFNMMLGGMFSSDLFRVIREENSLAYSVSSSIFFDNRLIIVNAGIDSANYQTATDLIIKEIQRYKDGNIAEKLLRVAKDQLYTGLRETNDDPFSNLTFILKNSLLKNYTIDEIIELVEKVTVEDVKKASQKVELDTIFCLKGETNG